jgi:hypothetical protein
LTFGKDIENREMLPFKEYYTISAAIFGGFVSIYVWLGTDEIGVGLAIVLLAVAAVAVLPTVWKGGILANPRLSISIAAIFALATGTMVGLEFLHFVHTGGGEISPFSNLISLTLGAAFGFCPWLLTTLRGLPYWNSNAPNKS